MMPSTGMTAILSEERLFYTITSVRCGVPPMPSALAMDSKTVPTIRLTRVKASMIARTIVAMTQPRPARFLSRMIGAGFTNGGGGNGGGGGGPPAGEAGGFGGETSLSITRRSYCKRFGTGK